MSTSTRMKGRNLMLFKTDADGKTGATAFAFATSCSLTTRLVFEEVNDKDAPLTGLLEVTKQEWDATTENGISSMEDYEKVMDMHLTGAEITLALTTVANPNNDGITSEHPKWDAATGGYYGTCKIESVSITAQEGQSVKFNATFKGTSTLKKRTAPGG